MVVGGQKLMHHSILVQAVCYCCCLEDLYSNSKICSVKRPKIFQNFLNSIKVLSHEKCFTYLFSKKESYKQKIRQEV